MADVVGLGRGTKLGRYVVAETIGAGGMGVVYAAHDPELDRRVALKLVRADADPARAEQRRERLLREAQTMARLSHPNVVTVHDVGVHGDAVFLAMELVEGTTLARWLAEGPRSLDQVLRTFIAAGRGLEAAHRAGLVHRDFKPDNVLVRASDDRVMVTDFGLARAEASVDSDPRPNRSPTAGSLTSTGTVLGTPAYMSPEQHRGEPSDARSDQFAFCVALYEGVYGARPFAPRPGPGIDVADALALETIAGRVRPPPRDRDVPAWLHRVLLRGLAVSPADRYPSMTELLADLGRDRGRRLRIAAVIAGVALAGAGGLALASRGGAPCAHPDRKLAGIWDESAKQKVRAAMVGTGKAYAEDTFRRASALLDRYAAEWTAMRGEACEATAVHHEQSPELLDRRMACLDDRLAAMASLAKFLGAADAAAVSRAVDAAGSLPRVAQCADTATLAARYAQPVDPVVAVKVAALRSRAAQADMLATLGQMVESKRLLAELADEARATGHAPLLVAVLGSLGRIEALMREAHAEVTLREAVRYAGEAHDDLSSVKHLAALMEFLSAKQRVEEATTLLAALEGAARRAGMTPEAEQPLRAAEAHMLWHAGRYQEAREAQEKAVAIRERLEGPATPGVARSLDRLAGILSDMGKFDEARAIYRRELAIFESSLGPDNPAVAISLNGLANITYRVGEREEALRLYRRSMEILERSMGPESALAATVQGNVGMVLDNLGRDDEAVVYYERSLATQRKVQGPDDPRLSSVLANLGAFWMRRKRPEKGLPYLEESVAVMEKRSPTNPELGQPLENLGVAYLEQGQPERALPVLERAAALIAQEHDPDFPDLAALRASLARGLAAMGRRDEAIPMVEQSIRILDAKEPKRTRRATAREILAKILWETPGGRARARTVAGDALAIYVADGEPSAEDAETLRTWLKGKR